MPTTTLPGCTPFLLFFTANASSYSSDNFFLLDAGKKVSSGSRRR
jgi:hypothetical protein